MNQLRQYRRFQIWYVHPGTCGAEHPRYGRLARSRCGATAGASLDAAHDVMGGEGSSTILAPGFCTSRPGYPSGSRDRRPTCQAALAHAANAA
jgi:hypothetical protein